MVRGCAYAPLRLIFAILFCIAISMVVWAGTAIGAGIPLSPNAQNAQKKTAREHMTKPYAGSGVLDLAKSNDWRLRIREAAVAHGDMVLLGDIAEPLGPIPKDIWTNLRTQALWPSPPEEGKPLQINRVRLTAALRDTLKDIASRCIIPNSLAIQKGGFVVREDELRAYVVKYLTPQLNALHGRAELVDFRLPAYIFLAHGQQQVHLEVGDIIPGKITFRFRVEEGGDVLRRVAGAAILNLWVEVPAAAKALNKGDPLNVEDITFINVNAAHLQGTPWDGRGGPWQVVRPIGNGQIIFQTDLLGLSMIRKGSIVLLVYEKGAVRMEVHAEALSDGAPGQTIAVRNLQSKRQIYALVRDSKTVVVQ